MLEDSLYGLLKIYKNLPYPIKSLVGYCYRCVPKRIKYGGFYFEYLRRIKSYEVNEMNFDVKNTIKILKNIPFYKKREFKTLEELPIINKEIIRANFKDFINPINQNKIKANTGGSSGTPFEFFLERGVSRPKEKAHFNWYWSKFGFKEGDRMLMIRGEALAGNKLFEHQSIENKLALSCYLINELNVSDVIKEINNFKPKFIHAYPSALKNFLNECAKSDLDLSLNIKAAFLGSEKLSLNDKRNFEKELNTNICHWYGHSERLVHAGSCPYSDVFHIYPFYGYVELIDENEVLINKPLKKGKIVATGFDNSVMPLVRYDTGDEAEYSEKLNCKCGFKGRSFKIIYGRSQDYIYLKDKTKVSLTAFIFGQHFEEFGDIKELQIIQKEYGIVLLKIIVQREKRFKLEEFVYKLQRSVNNKLIVKIEIVDSLEKTARGKQIFLKQKIKEPNKTCI